MFSKSRFLIVIFQGGYVMIVVTCASRRETNPASYIDPS